MSKPIVNVMSAKESVIRHATNPGYTLPGNTQTGVNKPLQIENLQNKNNNLKNSIAPSLAVSPTAVADTQKSKSAEEKNTGIITKLSNIHKTIQEILFAVKEQRGRSSSSSGNNSAVSQIQQTKAMEKMQEYIDATEKGKPVKSTTQAAPIIPQAGPVNQPDEKIPNNTNNQKEDAAGTPKSNKAQGIKNRQQAKKEQERMQSTFEDPTRGNKAVDLGSLGDDRFTKLQNLGSKMAEETAGLNKTQLIDYYKEGKGSSGKFKQAMKTLMDESGDDMRMHTDASGKTTIAPSMYMAWSKAKEEKNKYENMSEQDITKEWGTARKNKKTFGATSSSEYRLAKIAEAEKQQRLNGGGDDALETNETLRRQQALAQVATKTFNESNPEMRELVKQSFMASQKGTGEIDVFKHARHDQPLFSGNLGATAYAQAAQAQKLRTQASSEKDQLKQTELLEQAEKLELQSRSNAAKSKTKLTSQGISEDSLSQYIELEKRLTDPTHSDYVAQDDQNARSAIIRQQQKLSGGNQEFKALAALELGKHTKKYETPISKLSGSYDAAIASGGTILPDKSNKSIFDDRSVSSGLKNEKKLRDQITSAKSAEARDEALEAYQNFLMSHPEVKQKVLSSPETRNSVLSTIIGSDEITKMRPEEQARYLADMYGHKQKHISGIKEHITSLEATDVDGPWYNPKVDLAKTAEIEKHKKAAGMDLAKSTTDLTGISMAQDLLSEGSAEEMGQFAYTSNPENTDIHSENYSTIADMEHSGAIAAIKRKKRNQDTGYQEYKKRKAAVIKEHTRQDINSIEAYPGSMDGKNRVTDTPEFKKFATGQISFSELASGSKASQIKSRIDDSNSIGLQEFSEYDASLSPEERQRYQAMEQEEIAERTRGAKDSLESVGYAPTDDDRKNKFKTREEIAKQKSIPIDARLGQKEPQVPNSKPLDTGSLPTNLAIPGLTTADTSKLTPTTPDSLPTTTNKASVPDQQKGTGSNKDEPQNITGRLDVTITDGKTTIAGTGNVNASPIT